MYSFIGWQPGRPIVIHRITLGDAMRKLREIGRGAVFRGVPTATARPIYPKARTV